MYCVFHACAVFYTPLAYTYIHVHAHIQIACTDVAETVSDADILVFVMPHQFLRRTCESIKGHTKEGAFAISLIKVCTRSMATYICI